MFRKPVYKLSRDNNSVKSILVVNYKFRNQVDSVDRKLVRARLLDDEGIFNYLDSAEGVISRGAVRGRYWTGDRDISVWPAVFGLSCKVIVEADDRIIPEENMFDCESFDRFILTGITPAKRQVQI